MSGYEAWAVEERLWRPIFTVLFAIVGPWLVRGGLTGLFGAERPGARWAADAVLAAGLAPLCFLMGATALGPAWVSDAGFLTAVTAGLVALALTLSSLALARGRRGLRGLTSAAAWRRAGPGRGLGVAVAALVVLTLHAGALFAWTATALPDDGLELAGASAARWRLRVNPRDASAMLAAAWATRRDESVGRAATQLAAAREMGVAEPAALELEAELLALRGECDRAQAAFDRALCLRAEAAFEDEVWRSPLTLGDYRLPPALITRCSTEAPEIDLGEW